MSFRDTIQKERLKRGWSQAYMGESLKVSEATVRAWEAGRRSPGMESQRRLMELLGLTAEELAFDEIPIGLTAEEKENEGVAPPGGVSSVLSVVQEKVAFASRDRSRQRMLSLVRSRWVTGLLDRMGPSSLITLRLRMQSAVASVWREQGDMGLPSSLELPFGATIVQVYDAASGELLVLGEPGAGKTTQLLLLARELIERALLDPEHPIPVIFNLASWAGKKGLLVDWLVSELNEKYQVPLRLARSWIEQDCILPLLDGLDEVDPQDRPACVAAINKYRQEHGLLPIVVCCRTGDYNEMVVKLVLGDAVLLEALSSEQIDTYLERQGKAAASLRAALQRDQGLAEMVATPLMLSVIIQAYSGLSLDDVLAASTLEERRHIVFDRYVERVLARGSRKYSVKRVIAGLSWLARQMCEKNQAEFYVEQLQPDWLAEVYRIRYRSAVSRCVFGLQVIISYFFTACLRGPNVRTQGFPFVVSSRDILGWMSLGLGGIFQGTASLEAMWAVISVPVVFLVYRQKLPPQRLFRGIWQACRYGLVVFVLVGSISVFLFRFAAPAGGDGNGGIIQGLGLALLTSFIVFFLVQFFTFIRGEGEGDVVHGEGKGRKRVRHSFFQSSVVNSFVVGVLAASAFVIMYTAQGERLGQAVEYGIVMLLASWLMSFWVVRVHDGFEFFHGPGGEEVITPVEVVSWSWPALRSGAWENGRNALAVGSFYALWGVIFLGSMSALFHGWMYGLRYGLAYGIIIGVVSGLAILLTAMIKDLWSSDVMPVHQHNYPNVGIVLSARHGLRAALLFGPCAGIGSGIACALAFGLIGQLASWPVLSAAFTVVFTLYFAYAFFFGFGGNVVVEHYILRWYLWRSGVVPLAIVQFLDYTTHHILLRKIGGGYMFVHRLLLEYFADLS